MEIQLNEDQRKAVKHRGGPLLIIAGAGTGKTAVITQRIIDLINSGDAKPSEILALTFTEKASSEMIERVDMAMPIGYEEVMISTFHSFCDSILRQDCVYLGIDSNYSLMTQAQEYVFFRRHLYDFPLDTLRPLGNPASNIDQILKHFSRLQDEEVYPDEYIKYVSSLPESTEVEIESKKEYKELSETYKLYTELKLKGSKMNFGDLILQTIILFRKKPNILERYHKRYKYILVDEFQDTNYTQNVLVNLLALGGDPKDISEEAKSKAEVTVVGDDDQAIYKFRGAAISNILHFKETYPTAEKVVLTENYRSHQKILDCAHTLIQHNDPDRLEVTEEIDKSLISRVEQKGDVEPIKLLVGDTGDEESEIISKEILKLTGNLDKLKKDTSIVLKQYTSAGQGMFMDVDNGSNGNYSFSDIAILVRAHSHTEDIVKTLRRYGIPYKFGGARGLYSRPEVQDLISYLRVVGDYTDDISIYNVLSMDLWGIQTRELIEIFRSARRMKMSVFAMFEEIWSVKIGKDLIQENSMSIISELGDQILSQQAQNSIWKLLCLIQESFQLMKDKVDITKTLFNYFKNSGYMDQLLQKDDAETLFKIQNMGKYFELIQKYEKDNPGTNLFEYLDYLDYSINIGETPSIDADSLDEYDAVNIMTVHGSKGLEFPVVFVASLVSDRFPTRGRGNSLGIPKDLIKDIVSDVDDKTEQLREERRLFYVASTRAKELLYLTGAKLYGDAKRKKKPSVFLYEFMDSDISEFFNLNDKDRHNDINIDTLKFLDQESTIEIDIEQIPQLLPKTISYSLINDYETCPKKFKYRYILGIPTPPSSVLGFGSSVHHTLKAFYTLVETYQQSLTGFEKVPSVDDLLRIYDEKWISAGYDNKEHENLRKEFGRKKLKEYYDKFFDEKIVLLGVETAVRYHLEDVVLKGFIDRIDLLEIKEGVKHVEVIDYKTGSVKEEKDLKKNLQLLLYAVIAEESLGYKVDKASLIFIEHGVKISLDINDKLKQTGKDRVLDAVKLIRKGEFGPTPNYLCKYCEYRDICEDALLI